MRYEYRTVNVEKNIVETANHWSEKGWRTIDVLGYDEDRLLLEREMSPAFLVINHQEYPKGFWANFTKPRRRRWWLW